MLGTLAEVLPLLRRVDLVEPDLGQALVAIEDCQGVAIGDPRNPASEGFGVDMDRHNQAEQGDELHYETRAGVKSPSSPNEGEQRK